MPNFKFKGEHLSYRGFLKKYKNEKISSICNNDAGIVFYTGGTTGVSKSVLIKSSHLNETVYQYSLNAFYHECDHLLNCMPIFTCYGFVLSVHQPLLLGIEMFIIPLMKAKNMLKCIEKYKINHVFGVPSFFEKLINPNFKEDLSSLIYCLAAGDTMNVNKLNQINENLKNHKVKARLTMGYGMTETVTLGTSSVPFDDMDGTCGIPKESTIIKIVDDNNNFLPIGVEGNIVIGSNIGPSEYFLENKLIPCIHVDGVRYVLTGDIGFIDEKNYLHVIGRKKRMIVRYNGSKLFPSNVENEILSIKGVSSACVIGIKDMCHEFGNIPFAFIKLDGSVSKNIVQHKLKEMYNLDKSGYSFPSDYCFIKEMPVNKSGKIDYRKLEDIAYKIAKKHNFSY